MVSASNSYYYLYPLLPKASKTRSQIRGSKAKAQRCRLSSRRHQQLLAQHPRPWRWVPIPGCHEPPRWAGTDPAPHLPPGCPKRGRASGISCLELEQTVTKPEPKRSSSTACRQQTRLQPHVLWIEKCVINKTHNIFWRLPSNRKVLFPFAAACTGFTFCLFDSYCNLLGFLETPLALAEKSTEAAGETALSGLPKLPEQWCCARSGTASSNTNCTTRHRQRRGFSSRLLTPGLDVRHAADTTGNTRTQELAPPSSSSTSGCFCQGSPREDHISWYPNNAQLDSGKRMAAVNITCPSGWGGKLQCPRLLSY